jgi:hypothetical protein
MSKHQKPRPADYESAKLLAALQGLRQPESPYLFNPRPGGCEHHYVPRNTKQVADGVTSTLYQCTECGKLQRVLVTES